MELRAPGRVNLIGEHTDYSGGLVLPIAIQLGITLTFERSDDLALAAPGGERYVSAVWHELAKLGRPSVGIRGAVAADLPQGAGLGSSGAFSVGVALALCAVAEFDVEPLQLALACQRAEQRAVGVPAGILDQAASLLGREGSALLLNCATLDHRWVALPDDDVACLVLDSGERHSHEGSGYGDRRRELEAGEPRRVRHVETENERVRETVAALEGGEIRALGPIFAASHASLRDDYEVSTPTLDALVDAALSAGAFAARMTGGGFGGCVVALADAARAEAVLACGARSWRVRAADGAIRRRTGSPRDPA